MWDLDKLSDLLKEKKCDFSAASSQPPFEDLAFQTFPFFLSRLDQFKSHIHFPLPFQIIC